MRIAVIGRTHLLLRAAEMLFEQGHEIGLVWTARAEAFYRAKEEDFARFAERAGVLYVASAQINSPAAIRSLREANCALAISVNFPGIIGRESLDVFPLGILNGHAGDLPRYRGNACPNWAILNGERHVGLCIHLMAAELDAGPVVSRDYFPLRHDVYIGDVYAWLETRLPSMLCEAACGLADGSLTPEPQASRRILRTYPRRPEDGRIHWDQNTEDIFRLVRASSRPFAGAFSFLEGMYKFIIWRAEPYIPRFDFCAVPGQVCELHTGNPAVACRDGMLILAEIEFVGEARFADAAHKTLGSMRSRFTSHCNGNST